MLCPINVPAGTQGQLCSDLGSDSFQKSWVNQSCEVSQWEPNPLGPAPALSPCWICVDHTLVNITRPETDLRLNLSHRYGLVWWSELMAEYGHCHWTGFAVLVGVLCDWAVLGGLHPQLIPLYTAACSCCCLTRRTGWRDSCVHSRFVHVTCLV